MLSRVRSPRGGQRNLPAAFIIPCRPMVSQRPPRGPGWAHELKHDGYRLQIHVRGRRVRLYTMNGADWSKRYPRIVEEAARLREPVIIDAEVVCLSGEGVANFDEFTVAQPTRKRWLVLSTFFLPVMISADAHWLSERRN